MCAYLYPHTAAVLYTPLNIVDIFSYRCAIENIIKIDTTRELQIQIFAMNRKSSTEN